MATGWPSPISITKPVMSLAGLGASLSVTREPEPPMSSVAAHGVMRHNDTTSTSKPTMYRFRFDTSLPEAPHRGDTHAFVSDATRRLCVRSMQSCG